MHYIPPTQKNIWRLALFFNHFSIQRKVIFESFLYDPRRPIRRILHKILTRALNIKLLVLYHFNSKKNLHLKINMNATFSKKDSKNLDEIQATRMLMFQDDLIACTEVILILSLLEVISSWLAVKVSVKLFYESLCQVYFDFIIFKQFSYFESVLYFYYYVIYIQLFSLLLLSKSTIFSIDILL